MRESSRLLSVLPLHLPFSRPSLPFQQHSDLVTIVSSLVGACDVDDRRKRYELHIPDGASKIYCKEYM